MRDTIGEMADITTRPDADPQTNRWTTRTWKMPITPTRGKLIIVYSYNSQL